MKKLIIFILLINIFLLFPREASAHIIKIDDNIGVSIRVISAEPSVSGKPVEILINITDKSKRLNPSNFADCECFLSISQNNQILARFSIFIGNLHNRIKYIFPNTGTYKFTVEGKPATNNNIFQTFKVDSEYYLQGDHKNEDRTVSRNYLVKILPFISTATIVAVLYIIFRG